jgi:hypothetical protein
MIEWSHLIGWLEHNATFIYMLTALSIVYYLTHRGKRK